jgi:predicted RNase H-like HicB family nuclease
LYPAYIHAGDSQYAHGVTFPNFAGCFAAADEWADLPEAIQETVQVHFYGDLSAVPVPTA